MSKTVLTVLAIAGLFCLMFGWNYRRAHAIQGQTQNPEVIAKKVQTMFSDQNAFRASIVEFVRQVSTHDEAQNKHHEKLFEADGYWGRILAERDAILQEGLGPDYKNHPKINALEVEVLFKLGTLDVIRHYEAFQQLRAGDPYGTRNQPQ